MNRTNIKRICQAAQMSRAIRAVAHNMNHNELQAAATRLIMAKADDILEQLSQVLDTAPDNLLNGRVERIYCNLQEATFPLQELVDLVVTKNLAPDDLMRSLGVRGVRGSVTTYASLVRLIINKALAKWPPGWVEERLRAAVAQPE